MDTTRTCEHLVEGSDSTDQSEESTYYTFDIDAFFAKPSAPTDHIPVPNNCDGNSSVPIDKVVRQLKSSNEFLRLASDLDYMDFWSKGDEAVPAGAERDYRSHLFEGVPEADIGVCMPTFSTKGPIDIIAQLIGKIILTLNALNEHKLTIVREKYHIDPVYRDCYYTCYSRQHFETKRYSQRLSLFLGDVQKVFLPEASLDSEMKPRSILEDSFIGSCVINPLQTGTLGRLLIDPRYIRETDEAGFVSNESIRCSKFKVTVQGVPLHVKAFPYRAQDGLTLRCVEVTLVNLIEYYSNEYADYGFALPSQIHEREAELITERTIPAKGISYLTASKLLHSFGFQPRLHAVTEIEGERERFRRTLHSYIDSGIPTAINLATKDETSGHSLICIGYGTKPSVDLCNIKPSYTFRDTSSRSEYANRLSKLTGFHAQEGLDCKTASQILDAWASSPRCDVYFASDFYTEYVVMDDNQVPYSLRKLDNLSLYNDMDISMMLVALHKGIMLDARDAEDYAVELLSSSKTGMYNWAHEFFAEMISSSANQQTVIMRLFLASSRRFKDIRVKQFRKMGDTIRANAYATAVLPHFVWVSELYLYNGESTVGKERAFAEYVIDATFGKNKDVENSVVLWDYPDRIAFRQPDNRTDSFDRYRFEHGVAVDQQPLIRKLYKGILPFDGNLRSMAIDVPKSA